MLALGYRERTAKLIAKATVNRDYDVPYFSNRSSDGRTVYIDRHVPEKLVCGIDTGQTLPWHELGEWQAENDGMTYPEAHEQVATPLEQAAVEALGGDWTQYSAELAPMIKAVDREQLKRVPPDLDLRPYEDEDDRAVMEELAAATSKAARFPMSDRINFFLPIGKVEKQEDSSRLVSGYASTPTKDLDGEIVSIDAIKNALPGYMEWKNIRQMHQPLAVGRAKEAHIDEEGLYLTAKIVDEACIKLIDEQVLQGFSIGGRKLAKKGDTITDLELIEISVVDRPANPDCRIEVVKAAKPVAGFEMQKAGLVGASLGLSPGEDLIIPADEVGPLRKFFSNLFKREFSQKEREDAADSGAALPDGSYPIKNKTDLQNAIQAFGRAKNKAKVKAHIRRRAAALGATDMLPDSWGKFAKDVGSGLSEPLRKMIGHEIYDAAGAMDALRTITWVLESEMMEQAEGEEDDGDLVQMEALRNAIAHLKAFIASEIQEDTTSGEETTEAKQSAAVTGEDNPDTADAASAFEQLRKDIEMAGNDLNKRMSGAHSAAISKVAHHLGKAAACHGSAMKCMKMAAAGCSAMKAANKSLSWNDLFKDEGIAGHIMKAVGHMDDLGEHLDMAQMHIGKVSVGGGSDRDFAGEGGTGLVDEDNVGGNAGDMDQGELTDGEVPEYPADTPYPGKSARTAARPKVVTEGQAKAMVEAAVKAATLELENANLKAQLDTIKAMPAQNRARAFGPNRGVTMGMTGGDKTTKLLAGINPAMLDDKDGAIHAATQALTNMFADPAEFGKSVMSSEFKGRPHARGN